MAHPHDVGPRLRRAWLIMMPGPVAGAAALVLAIVAARLADGAVRRPRPCDTTAVLPRLVYVMGWAAVGLAAVSGGLAVAGLCVVLARPAGDAAPSATAAATMRMLGTVFIVIGVLAAAFTAYVLVDLYVDACG